MRIKQKLVLGFVTVALLTGAVGYVSVNMGKKALKKAIGENSVSLATDVLDRIDSGIYRRIEELQIHSADLEARKATKESNAAFAQLSDIQGFINEKNAEWVSVSYETVTPFMQELIDNELSKELRGLKQYFEDKHGYTVFSEIFVANKYGANVAQTGKTSDYYQADEQWWQTAKKDGLFVSDVEYDQSSGVYSLTIGVKVSDENGNFLGAMKAVLNIEDAIRTVKQSRKLLVYKIAKVRLFDKTGKLIFDETGEFEFLDDVPGKELLKEMTGNAGYSLKEGGSIEDKKLVVYARSNGYRDYKGLGWVLTVQYDAEEIFASVTKLSNAMLYFSVAMTIVAVLIGSYFSRSISKPITTLKKAADDISKGRLNTRIQIDSDDEVGELAKSFNRMAENLAKDMAERKKAEENLSLTRAVVEQAAECIALLDLEGRFVLTNPALCESLGYTEQELLRMTVSDIDPNVISQDHPRLYWASLPLKKTLSFESEHHRRDGTTFPVKVRLCLIEMNGHKHILASARDITERKNAERQFFEHTKFLESLDKINRAIQSAGDVDQMMTDVLDTMLSIFDCDRAWLLCPCDPDAPFWGVPVERTKPQYPGAMALGDNIRMSKGVADASRAVLNSSKPVQFGPGSEYPLWPEDAQRFKYKSRIAIALYPKVGQPWMFGMHQCSYPRQWTPEEERLFQAIGRRLADALTSLLIFRDLQQSEQQYRAMFEQAIDSVVLMEPDTGKIEEFNDKACRNLGYAREEFEKLNLSDIEAVESPEDIAKHMDKIAKQGIDVFETKHRTKSGRIRDILVSAKIISVHGRKLAQAIFRDITDQKRATEKLNEYQTKLKSMAVTSLLSEERQRKRIALELHDDIGQKLAVAKLDLQSSLHGNVDPDTAQSAKKVCSEIDTMIENVRTLTFELSNPVLTELGLEAAIERHLAREIRDKHGIEFELNKSAAVAKLDEDISMCLFRSVRELLNNVVKHANAKKVTVSLDKNDGNIVITVNDDGVGFDTVTVNSKINAGVGFGLFSIREQLETFAGKLNVQSAPGKGSNFTITLPLP